MFAPITQDPRLLHATSAINVTNGQIGGSGGAAGDTQLLGYLILKNAGPATLTVAGFKGEDGTARNMVFTGSTTVDTVVNLPGLRNTGAAMTVTASVADTCMPFLAPS